MDDPTRTRKTLDHLADLYLTGPVAPPLSPTKPALSRGAPVTPPRPHPVGQRSARVDQLDAPGPISLPSLSHRVPPTPGHQLGLGPPPLAASSGGAPKTISGPGPLRSEGLSSSLGVSAEPPWEPNGAPCRVEAVFLGNLPGLSGPWLAQYAYGLSKRGPVGVLSVDGGELDVELVAHDRQELSRLHAAVAAGGAGPRTASEVFDVVFELANAGVGSWLVHLPTPITDQARRCVLALDHWTLISGSDDAAVVAAYRLLKQLGIGDWVVADGSADHRRKTPRVGVVMVGGDEASSREAVAKLSHAAGRFLCTPVELIGSQKKMAPVQVRSIASWTGDERDLESRLRRFIGDLIRLEGAGPKQTQPRADQPPQPARNEALHAGPRPPQPPPPQAGKVQEPCPQRHAVASGHELELTRFLDKPVTLLPVRCPLAPQVQLVVDQAGCLGLLMCQACAGSDARPVHLDAAVVELMEINQWARVHIPLLQWSVPKTPLDPEVPPKLHLFTDQAKAAVALIGQLGSFVKLHLLQEVRGADAGRWLCTDLN